MLALVAATVVLPPAFDFEVRSGVGLTLRLSGVPIVRGNWLQYGEPDGSRAYYASTNAVQQVEKTADGYKVSFRSGDGRAFGTQHYVRAENRLKVTYELNWSGDRPVKVDLAAGLIWARIFQGGSLFLDQKPARSMAPTPYADADPGARKYGEGFGEAVFQSALGKVVVAGSSPVWTLYDGRGLKQQWANRRELFYLGQPALQLQPGTPAKAEIEYRFEPTVATAKTVTRSFRASPLANARLVHQDDAPILPKPKQALFDRAEPFPIGDELRLDLPDRYQPLKKELVRAIQRWWIAPNLKAPTTHDPNIYCRVENLGLPPEGFEIRVNKKTIIVWGQDEAGLRYALQTLGSLAFAQNGKLYFPSGTMRDWPSVGWRGVHLFGGPELRTFHPRLAERVLVPLRFNKVVLQCERTKWDSQPGIHRPESSVKTDLKFAFDMFREKGIEPFPLIQSLGHMEWFFANGQNHDLAINPLVPYTIDLRKEAAQKALGAIWDEAISLLKPRAIHFGLDEIDNRGMKKEPNETSEVWTRSLPFLNGLALRYGVTPVLWGDQGLAPNQAVDAAHGDDPAHAKRRRDAIARGAWVTDWHYKNDPEPDRFQSSLNLWKSEGFFPIASGWFNADNIAGFTQAAYRSGAGYLQTTWAGYETTEEGVHREMRQFAAYVLAADYAWSGRADPPGSLEYDPVDVLTRLLYAEPSPLSPAPGTSLEGARLVRIGDLSFRVGEPQALLSLVSPGGAGLPSEIKIDVDGLRGQTLGLAMDCLQPCEDRDPVADLEIELDSGQTLRRTLLYGVHVRSGADRRDVGAGARGEGLSALLIPLGGSHEVKHIRLTALSTYAGARLHGATAY